MDASHKWINFIFFLTLISKMIKIYYPLPFLILCGSTVLENTLAASQRLFLVILLFRHWQKSFGRVIRTS
jgi:hypothetical protein